MVKGLTAGFPTLVLATVTVIVALDQPAFSQGVILWDESVNGELSQDFTHPTSLAPVIVGTNSVVGVTEVVPSGNNWIGFPDYFLLSVPTNLAISALYLSIDKPNVWAWIGDPTYSDQAGWVQNPTNGNLMLQWGSSMLPQATYGMYLANHDHEPGGSAASYRLDFVAEPTPEPSSAGLLLLGFAALEVFRRCAQLAPCTMGKPPPSPRPACNPNLFVVRGLKCRRSQ